MSSNYKLKKMPNNVILDSNILPQTKGLKSTFNLSENLKTTIDFDYLYPVFWEELNPGDHFEMKVSSICRLMPTVAPVMDNIKLKYMAFWVPNRLVWEHWMEFMGQKTWQDSKTEYLVPQINMKVAENKSCGLADYLGCPPTGTTCEYSVSALPFRAYNKIWNEWLRAPEIQPELKEFIGDNLVTDKAENKDTLATYNLLKKGKPLDYFTSCLPSPQASDPVEIPLSGNALVGTTNPGHYVRLLTENPSLQVGMGNDSNGVYTGSSQINEQVSDLYADMSDVTGITIEALRKATALQVLLETDSRYGQRYPELIKGHWGVTTPDFLLGRTTFLGSCTSDIVVNPVVQNSSTDSTSPQGNLTGVGMGQQYDKLCEVSAMEHGIFMVLACATADVTYQQGVQRKFNKLSRFDYMFPEFWNLGDQAVYNKEIFLSADAKTNEGIFGYQERYRELREGINKITGKLRSGVDGSLDVWHLAEKFANLPKLNSQFLENNTPINRVLAVENEPDLIMDIWFDIKATRVLPVTAKPSMLAGRL